MIDACLDEPVAKEVDSIRKDVTAQTSMEYGFHGYTADETLVEFTDKKGVLLVTVDERTIKKSKYKPCYHGGIILIKESFWTPESIKECLKNFCKVEKRRQLAKRHFTHLWKDRAIVYTHIGKEEFNFKDDKNAKRGKSQI
jgi:hypothetical protein